jgi:hypothetical protein
MTYGLEAHKVAEEYVRDGKALPPAYAYLQPLLAPLMEMPGDKYCEHKMGLTKDLKPIGFMEKGVWWRGIADLLVVQDDKAKIIDYKTGKRRYADTKQLEILTLAVFKHFPDVQEVKTGLLFVVDHGFVPATFSREDESSMWDKWGEDIYQLESAYSNNVWNPVKNFTCNKFCPVRDCAHNGANR